MCTLCLVGMWEVTQGSGSVVGWVLGGFDVMYIIKV